MNKKIIMAATAGLTALLFGCSNDDSGEANQNGNVDTQQMHYQNENNDRQGNKELSIGEKGGYPQSDLSGTNASNGHSGNYTDVFTNEESKKIYSHIMKRKEIKQAQVASTDDKVIVAVMLNDHSNHNIRDMIEKEVKSIAPDKQIVVYTDDIKWDRMQNLKSRLGPTNGAENVKNEIKRLFNMDND